MTLHRLIIVKLKLFLSRNEILFLKIKKKDCQAVENKSLGIYINHFIFKGMLLFVLFA